MLEVMRKISTNDEVNDDYDSDDAIGTVFRSFYVHHDTTTVLSCCEIVYSSFFFKFGQVCLISVDFFFDAPIL
jgi:hypothetical protein